MLKTYYRFGKVAAGDNGEDQPAVSQQTQNSSDCQSCRKRSESRLRVILVVCFVCGTVSSLSTLPEHLRTRTASNDEVVNRQLD